MDKRTIAGAAVICMAFLIVSCTDKNLAGNVTQTGNPTIAGLIYQPDGKSPSPNAKVYLRKKNSLIDTSSIELMSHFAPAATAITDAGGHFAICSVAVGAYVIECADDRKNCALIDSVAVKSKDETVTLPPTTLTPAGAITGVIRLSEGGDPRTVLILVFSVDKYARVNADGSFTLSPLAQGSYDLRLLSSLDDYKVVDTFRIPVASDNTTDLDTIDLPFSGIPTPQDVALRFDTLKQEVTLSWRKTDTALVKGFYVYRRNVDSNTVFERINIHPIADTVYRDNRGVEGQTYEYRIAAIDKNATEGVKSSEVSTRIASCFIVDTVFGKCGAQPGKLSLPNTLSVGKNGIMYIIENNTQPRIQVFDTNFTFIRQFGETVLNRPGDVAIATDGRVVVADCGLQEILIFNPADSSTQPAAIDVPALNNLALDGKNRIIATSGGDSVYVFGASGAVLRKWGGSGVSQGRFDQPTFVAADASDNIYICDSDNRRIQAFDSSGTFKNSFTVSEHLGGVTVDARTGRIFSVGDMGNFLDVYTADGTLVAHYNFSQYGLYNMPCGIEINGKAVYVVMSGVCKIVKLCNNLP